MRELDTYYTDNTVENRYTWMWRIIWSNVEWIEANTDAKKKVLSYL